MLRLLQGKLGGLHLVGDFNDDNDNNEQQQLEEFQENGVNDWDLMMMKRYKNSAFQKRVQSGEKSATKHTNIVNSYGSSPSSSRSLRFLL